MGRLRRQGILIVGSGNMVHNLGVMMFQDAAYDWAAEFDEALRQRIVARDHDALIYYERLGPAARLAVPTNEHYLPLLYVLALQDPQEPVRFFADRVTYGSLSMRSVWVGPPG